MPALLHRVGEFCERMDTETEPQDARDLIRVWFCTGDYRLGLWAGIDSEGKLVAHCFATPEPLGNAKWNYVLIRQAQIDPGVDMHKENQLVFEDVQRWTKGFGLSRIVMLTHRDADVFARAWKFERYKSLMKRDLES